MKGKRKLRLTSIGAKQLTKKEKERQKDIKVERNTAIITFKKFEDKKLT